MYYYINSAGQQAGPVPADQLAANGITANTLVWKDGMNEWTKASDVPELRFLFDPTVPPPAPTNSTNTANDNANQTSFFQSKTFAIIVGICGAIQAFNMLFNGSGFWNWLLLGVLGAGLYFLWKAIKEKAIPEKGHIWTVIIITLIGGFFSPNSKYGDLFEITDEFVGDLQTKYESYGFVGSDFTKYTDDNEYKVCPVGRLINVRIEHVATDEEYEELREALESHYSGDSRVNQVYRNGAGTLMIDCRN